MPTIAVYSSATGRVRRIVTDDRAGITPERIAQIHRQPGEEFLPLTVVQRADPQAAVTAATGKTPVNDRYAIVRSADGVVVGAIIADPGCGDSAPRNHELVAHDRASPGWRRLVDGTLARPQADIDLDIADRQASRGRLRGARFDGAPEQTIQAQEAAFDNEIATLQAERSRT